MRDYKKTIGLSFLLTIFPFIPLKAVTSQIDKKDYIYTEENSDFDYTLYIIITSDSIKTSFEPLSFWLTKKGLRASIISVDTILSIYSYDPVSNIYDDAGAVRAFLMDAYSSGTRWVLLGGDEDLVPVRYGSSKNNDTTVPERPPSDLYFADFDGNWNVDGDSLFGEPIDDSVDIYPELYIGRLPCSKSWEVKNWINKILSYEKNPGDGDYDYLRRIFWTGADEMRYIPGYLIDNAPWPLIFLHDTTMLEDSNGINPKGSDVISRMNNFYGMFNFYGHGAPDQLTVSAPGDNWSGPNRDFIVSLDSCEIFHNNLHPNSSRIESGNGLDSLQNTDYYGILYLSSCYQGAYDHEHFPLFDIYCGPSMSEAFTLLPDRGGVAMLGYTRYTEEIPSMILHQNFLEVLFDDTIPNNIGEVFMLSKVRRYYPHFIHLSHTLFGDPAMPVWTNIPEIFEVIFSDAIPPESLDYEVTVNSHGQPVEYATVCLWKENEVFSKQITDSAGKSLHTIHPLTEGEMHITVTGKNYIPFEDTVFIRTGAIVVNQGNPIPILKVNTISLNNIIFRLYADYPGKIEIDIFDISGKKIKRLIKEFKNKGYQDIPWNGYNSNGNKVSTGIYFYNVHYRKDIIKGKLLYLK